MISRLTARLRVTLLLMVLLAAGGIDPHAQARGATPYKFTSQTEGDPGDGVLRPAVDGPGGREAGAADHYPGVADQTSSTPVTAPTSPAPVEYFLVPFTFPVGPGGSGAMILVPRSWTRTVFWRPVRDGRWHHVP